MDRLGGCACGYYVYVCAYVMVCACVPVLSSLWFAVRVSATFIAVAVFAAGAPDSERERGRVATDGAGFAVRIRATGRRDTLTRAWARTHKQMHARNTRLRVFPRTKNF